MNSFAIVHSAVTIIIPKGIPTNGTDAKMKILSKMNVVFSLIGSAVMTPEFAEASNIGSKALVSENDVGATTSGPTHGSGVEGAPLEVPPPDLWIEALKVPTRQAPHQSQYEAVVDTPRVSVEPIYPSLLDAASWQPSLLRDERAPTSMMPAMSGPFNLEMPSVAHLSGATIHFPASFDY